MGNAIRMFRSASPRGYFPVIRGPREGCTWVAGGPRPFIGQPGPGCPSGKDAASGTPAPGRGSPPPRSVPPGSVSRDPGSPDPTVSGPPGARPYIGDTPFGTHFCVRFLVPPIALTSTV